jgi:ArsR family transcriptional regulator, arsenate/arsenite/antimonite-responsive transcriptional repressor / arsenate reductase (thioredoxin)
VPDPVRIDTDEAFETAYTDLTHRIDRLAAALDHPGSRLAPGRSGARRG